MKTILCAWLTIPPTVAYGLRGALRGLGYRRFVLGPLSALKYRVLVNDGENVIQIALGSHRPGMLTRWYIVFHTENMFDTYIHLVLPRPLTNPCVAS